MELGLFSQITVDGINVLSTPNSEKFEIRRLEIVDGKFRWKLEHLRDNLSDAVSLLNPENNALPARPRAREERMVYAMQLENSSSQWFSKSFDFRLNCFQGVRSRVTEELGDNEVLIEIPESSEMFRLSLNRQTYQPSLHISRVPLNFDSSSRKYSRVDSFSAQSEFQSEMLREGGILKLLKALDELPGVSELTFIDTPQGFVLFDIPAIGNTTLTHLDMADRIDVVHELICRNEIFWKELGIVSLKQFAGEDFISTLQDYTFEEKAKEAADNGKNLLRVYLRANSLGSTQLFDPLNYFTCRILSQVNSSDRYATYRLGLLESTDDNADEYFAGTLSLHGYSPLPLDSLVGVAVCINAEDVLSPFYLGELEERHLVRIGSKYEAKHCYASYWEPRRLAVVIDFLLPINEEDS